MILDRALTVSKNSTNTRINTRARAGQREGAMGKLDGMVAWVTGAGRMRGIGRAIARRLAADGADVMVTAIARDPSRLPAHEQAEDWRGAESLAAEIRAIG